MPDRDRRSGGGAATGATTRSGPSVGVGRDLLPAGVPSISNGFSLTVYDAAGHSVGGMPGGVSSVTNGPLKPIVPLYEGLTPGGCTVGFTLTDVGGLHTQYGYPIGGGLPAPADRCSSP
ncbi:hypothetical protein ACFV2H_30980 [Streptomyces sp. NPDC059629]|uniref:hypothetical protein n=1 Tax=Streptomyces sp. NPDC059629 TaxID=3346889 RepID=UPI0036C25CFF